MHSIIIVMICVHLANGDGVSQETLVGSSVKHQNDVIRFPEMRETDAELDGWPSMRSLLRSYLDYDDNGDYDDEYGDNDLFMEDIDDELSEWIESLLDEEDDIVGPAEVLGAGTAGLAVGGAIGAGVGASIGSIGGPAGTIGGTAIGAGIGLTAGIWHEMREKLVGAAVAIRIKNNYCKYRLNYIGSYILGSEVESTPDKKYRSKTIEPLTEGVGGAYDENGAGWWHNSFWFGKTSMGIVRYHLGSVDGRKDKHNYCIDIIWIQRSQGWSPGHGHGGGVAVLLHGDCRKFASGDKSYWQEHLGMKTVNKILEQWRDKIVWDFMPKLSRKGTKNVPYGRYTSRGGDMWINADDKIAIKTYMSDKDQAEIAVEVWRCHKPATCSNEAAQCNIRESVKNKVGNHQLKYTFNHRTKKGTFTESW